MSKAHRRLTRTWRKRNVLGTVTINGTSTKVKFRAIESKDCKVLSAARLGAICVVNF